MDMLRDEHAAITRALSILADIDRHLVAGQAIDVQDLSDLLDFFSDFADACHHGKEEDLLFPALLHADASQSRKPIERLQQEHAQGRQWVAKMREALQPLAPQAFHDAAHRYTRMLLEHIDKENHVLLPMAARLLSARQLAHLWQDFEAFETRVMGNERHEALHHLLHRLQTRYPA